MAVKRSVACFSTGTFGNAIVLYVFSRRKDRLVSTLFIISLAVVDFFTCLVVIPFTIYMEYVSFWTGSDVLCKVYHFLVSSNIPFSAMIMVAIAVDRYFSICHPWWRAIDMSRARVTVACLAFIAITLGVIVACMYSVYESSDDVYGMLLENNIDDVSIESFDDPCLKNMHKDNCSYPAGEVLFRGQCLKASILLGKDFQQCYEKVHMTMYAVCFVTVIVLYVAIYRSVLMRRSRRRRDRRRTQPTVTYVALQPESAVVVVGNGLMEMRPPPPAGNDQQLTTTTAAAGGDDVNDAKDGRCSSSPAAAGANRNPSGGGCGGEGRPPQGSFDSHLLANLKTAVMLFVVTVVFIITFSPAFLMLSNVVPYNKTIFYLYFANNVANPVIYSFMNKNFREGLKRLVCSRKSSRAAPVSGRSNQMMR